MASHRESDSDIRSADAELILRVRSGDRVAFAELWRRHYRSGIAVARAITSRFDADDLVQESYTRMLQAMLKGGGPTGSFRAYLFTTIRNTAAAWGGARRETAVEEMDALVDLDTTDDAADALLDRGLTVQAFQSLPARWQEVLWYTDVERMKPGEVAPLLGMNAGAVAQLAFRAREGLREAWITAHLRVTATASECRPTTARLGAYVRGNLGARARARTERHLDECARCRMVAVEAKEVSQRLRVVLLPLVLGTAGTSGYLAAMRGGGTPVAVPPMPSDIVEGGGPASVVAVGGRSAPGGSAATGLRSLVRSGSATFVVTALLTATAFVLGFPHDSGSIPARADHIAALAATGPQVPGVDVDAPVAQSTSAREVSASPEPPLLPSADQDEDARPPVSDSSPPAIAPVPAPGPAQVPDPAQPLTPVASVTPSERITLTARYLSGCPVRLVVEMHVRGTPGASAQALIEGRSAPAAQTGLDEAGRGVLTIFVTLAEKAENPTITLQYTTENGPLFPWLIALSSLAGYPDPGSSDNTYASTCR